jgi:hypothetical protein
MLIVCRASPVINAALCTDFGNVGRNPTRGLQQFNSNLDLSRQFRLRGDVSFEIRCEASNVPNVVNLPNPVANFNGTTSGGPIYPTSGLITIPGEFGTDPVTSGNPRILQIAAWLTF